jgi:putative endonuclease
MYTVYLLRCSDGTYYTGVTTDIDRRVSEHNTSEKGAKYTKPRRPVVLVYREAALSRSEAQKREYVLRNLPRAEKEKLAAQ